MAPIDQAPAMVREFACLQGGGGMGALMRSTNWSATPLGPVEHWPLPLRIAVNICLNSRFPILIWWGPDLVMLYNDGYREILADKHPHALGAPGREVWSEVWDVVGPMLESVLRTGEATHSRDLRLLMDRKGFLEESYFEFSYSPIHDGSGAVAGIFTPVTETTERVIGERRLRTLHDLGRLGVAESTTDACRAAVHVLGGNRDDVPAAACYRLDGKFARLVCSTSGTEEPDRFPGEIPLDAPEGAWPLAEVVRLNRRITLDGSVFLPLTQAGDASQQSVLVAGISPRREFDDAYAAFFDLVGSHIAGTLAQTSSYEQTRHQAELLAELDRVKTTFFSNISHEFRTPLTLLLGPIEEFLSRPESLADTDRERLKMAHRNGLRLLRLVNALLDFARIESGRMHACYEAVDLASLTTDMASMFRSAIQSAGLRFTVSCRPFDEPVYVDRDMWEKIVLNLLSNALKYTVGGQIGVSLGRDGESALLAVSDTGVGIPSAELPRIFERFHRVAGKQARTFEGTGIGLALVQELVHIHQGTIEVESEEGRGTTFRVRIPLGTAHLPHEAVAATRRVGRRGLGEAFVEEAKTWLPDAERPPSAQSPDALAPRILVADDNADMRAYLRRLLDRYDVLSAPDGVRALELLRTRVPDLVLLDVMMPGLDGIEMLRQLREDPVTSNIPVILLSARAGEEQRVDGLRAGADDYLQKPFHARELVARVEGHLQMARMRASSERHQKGLRAEAEAANRMLEMANEELRQFSYAASHDLQAPLRMIGTHTELLKRRVEPGDPEIESSLGFILAGVERMRSLVRDLLSYSVALHADREPDVPVDLRFVLKQVLMLHEPLLRETAGEVHAGELPTVASQWSPMSQLLQNLIGNALKYRHPDRAPRIHVSARRRNSHWEITVADNGAGFDPQYAHQVFGLFKRLHGDSIPGSGLGLAICKRLVEKRGGRIWAESQPGIGSQFHFTVAAI